MGPWNLAGGNARIVVFPDQAVSLAVKSGVVSRERLSACFLGSLKTASRRLLQMFAGVDALEFKVAFEHFVN